MGRRLTALALAGALAAAPATAGEITVIDGGSQKIVTFAGAVQRDDPSRLTTLFSEVDGLREVRFNSRGGSLEAGIEIGEAIRARRLATRVTSGAVCASACVYAFLGGIIRTVDAGGRVGIHMASGAFNDAYVKAIRDVLTDPNIGSIDDRVRFIIQLNEQFSAIAARRQARFLAEMGVSLGLLGPSFDTPHLDIHWLTRAELATYNVVN